MAASDIFLYCVNGIGKLDQNQKVCGIELWLIDTGLVRAVLDAGLIVVHYGGKI
jgi:hypothetical protein